MIFVLDQFKDDFNNFLKNNALWMALVLVGIIVITIVVILICGRKVKKQPEVQVAEKSAWVKALGEEDNIVSTEAIGSRLVVALKDNTKMNKDELKSLGVTSIIEMSHKVTLLLEDKAEKVKAELDKK